MISTFLLYLFICIFLLLAIPVVFIAIEVIAALLAPIKKMTAQSKGSRPRSVILIPAYNEEHGIGATLEEIKRQMTVHDQLLVVADNCNDRTAEMAREYGAVVLERQDAQHRGKGFALDFGVASLRTEPPDVVLICDADATLIPGSLERLIWKAHLQQRPVQAKYLLTPPCKASARTRVSAFAFLFKNMVRPLGLSRLGGGCLLTGTGMAFPWSLIEAAPLASSNIVEDMQLGIDLAIAGNAPLFCPDAVVKSDMAPDSASEHAQRTRWEHGHLQTMRHQASRLIWQSLRQKRLDLLLLGLELAVPPLASLVLLLCAVCCVVVVLGIIDLLPVSIVMAYGILVLVLIVSILLAWSRFGKEMLSLRHLLAIPLYIISKIPIYISFIVKPKKEWVRTSREGDNKKASKE